MTNRVRPPTGDVANKLGAGLDRGLLRVIEALARRQAQRDYAATYLRKNQTREET